MQVYRLTLQPLTAFGTPLAGDTLFGSLCWMLRRMHGEARLAELLDGYCHGRPYAVLSDGMPSGFVPLPAMPSTFWNQDEEEDRKAVKKRRWLRREDMARPMRDWRRIACSDGQAAAAVTGSDDAGQQSGSQPHNSINRRTGTTGSGRFAPFSMTQTWYHPAMLLDVYAVVDSSRLSVDELAAALEAIGNAGYGRDASTGLGKFRVTGTPVPHEWSDAVGARAWMTLAPCAPQGLGFDSAHSYYQLLTRFGRHGDVAALGPNAFKKPLLMAAAGAVFSGAGEQYRHFLGQGIGGVSHADARTVHQGYAPVIPLPEEVTA